MESIWEDMKESDIPVVFWGYCSKRLAGINNLTARNVFQLEEINAHFYITGEDGDISDLYQLNLYEWCYYLDHTVGFPIQREILGRVLDPAKGKGNEMAQWILTKMDVLSHVVMLYH